MLRRGYQDDDGSNLWADDLETRSQARYRNELRSHPDCRDPDHPGCPECEETQEDNE